MDVALRSDTGSASSRNDDACLCEGIAGNATFLGVADGFGAIGEGPTAPLALGYVRDYLCRKLRRSASAMRVATVSEIRGLMQDAFAHANARLYTQSGSHDDYVSSGTTMTCALVVGHQAFIGHAGDSRAYLMRSGSLQLLTSDDVLVSDPVPSAKASLRSEARMRSILTRTLGTQASLAATVAQFEVVAGDQLVLCTDGVHRYLDGEDFMWALGRDADAQHIAGALLLTAKARGGSDNATVVVGRDLHVHASPARVAPAADRTDWMRRCLWGLALLWVASVVYGTTHVLSGLR